jgi:hypothetical protein
MKSIQKREAPLFTWAESGQPIRKIGECCSTAAERRPCSLPASRRHRVVGTGPRAAPEGGGPVLGVGAGRDSPQEELHGGARRAGRCAGEGPLHGLWQPVM